MSASLLRDLVDVDQLSVSSYLSCSWSFMVNIIHHFRKKSMDQCGRLSSNSRIWGLDWNCIWMCGLAHLNPLPYALSFQTLYHRHWHVLFWSWLRWTKPILHIHPCIHNDLPDYFLTPTKFTIRSNCTGRWLKYRHENAVCFRVFDAKKRSTISLSLCLPPLLLVPSIMHYFSLTLLSALTIVLHLCISSSLPLSLSLPVPSCVKNVKSL